MKHLGSRAGLYQIDLDEEGGLVWVTVTGLWHEPDLDAYAAAIAPALHTTRRRHGIAKLLVDRRAAPVQSPNLYLRHRELSPSYLREHDALAYVVSSTLASMQARRMLVLPRSRVLLDPGAALTWLTTV